jgi:hypothetical protein
MSSPGSSSSARCASRSHHRHGFRSQRERNGVLGSSCTRSAARAHAARWRTADLELGPAGSAARPHDRTPPRASGCRAACPESPDARSAPARRSDRAVGGRRRPRRPSRGRAIAPRATGRLEPHLELDSVRSSAQGMPRRPGARTRSSGRRRSQRAPASRAVAIRGVSEPSSSTVAPAIRPSVRLTHAHARRARERRSPAPRALARGREEERAPARRANRRPRR